MTEYDPRIVAELRAAMRAEAAAVLPRVLARAAALERDDAERGAQDRP